MGGGDISDEQLSSVGVEIIEKDEDGDRKLKIPTGKIGEYIQFVKSGLSPGFWNEIIGEKEIIFVFKFKDGQIKEFKLSPENGQEIDKLCAEFNNEPPDKTENIYKYLSENSFYHDFMITLR